MSVNVNASLDAGEQPAAARRYRLAVALLTLFFIAMGIRGVDYGDEHWDEPTVVKQLVYALEHRVPFPRWYYYPSGIMMVLGVAAAPEIATHGLDGASAALMELPYRLRARALLIVLTALTIPATFVLARRARCSLRASLFAAALVATSFQLQTHARFIVPNTIHIPALVWCAALLLSAAARCRSDSAGRAALRALGVAAFLGGVAAGVKYNAGIVAIPLAIAAWQLGGSKAQRAWRVVVAGSASLLGFFVTTPGAFFEPHFLLRGLEFQRVVYAKGWLGYTVDGPLEMVKAMAGYFAFALLSPFSAVACALAALALLGTLRAARDRSQWIAWLVPLSYAMVFLTQRIFIDRNFLPLIPFAAVFAALGADVIADTLANRLPRSSIFVSIVLGGFAALGMAYLTYAANTIVDRHSDRFVRELSAFLARQDDEEFLVSPRVRDALARIGAEHQHQHERIVAAPTEKTTYVLAYPDELHREHMWPSTDPFLAERVFGPREVEWRYAPTWRGAPRIVMLDIDKARAIGASLTFTPDDGPELPHFPMEILGR